MKHSSAQTGNAPDNGAPTCDNGPVDIADIDERDIDLRIDMGSTEEVAWALHREVWPDLPIILRMVWDGEPVSKSRARFTGRGSKTRAYTPEKTRTAENRIITLTRAEGLRGPVDASSTFGIFAKFFCGGWQRRDVDNMLKLVADALTGVIWDDDSQVSEMSASVQRGVGKEDARTHLLIYKTMANTHPVVKCKNCGTEVRQYASSKPQYCSDDCRLAARRTARRKTCVHCGKTWDPGKPSTAAYCSKECRSLHERVDVVCSNCGIAFTRQANYTRAANHCSAECAAAYHKAFRVKLPKGTCEECGEGVSRAEYKRCRACSRKGKGVLGKPQLGTTVLDRSDIADPYVTPKGRAVADKDPS